MVDLPPPIEELNEYGRFAFLNEMQTIAAQLIKKVPAESPLSKQLQIAADAIEAEIDNMEKLFDTYYKRPQETNTMGLIIRCAELYMSNNQWLQLANAYIYFKENAIEDVDEIETCFARTENLNNYCISSPMIELTLTRLDMFNYFKEQQEKTFKGTDPAEHDETIIFTLDVPPNNDFDLFQNADIPSGLKNYNSLILSDREYLEMRERLVWAVLRKFIPLGTICCLIYNAVILLLSIITLLTRYAKYGHTAIALASIGGFNVIFEVFTMRFCMVTCCKPGKHIDCLYPGLDLYIVQWFTNIFAALVSIAAIVLEFSDARNNDKGDIPYLIVIILAIHNAVSVFLPLLTQFFFFTWHQRYEMKFKWIRLGFFKKSGWKVFEIISFVLFPPSFSGTEALLVSGLRNKPRETRSKDLELLTV